jgi:hypothetical protein
MDTDTPVSGAKGTDAHGVKDSKDLQESSMALTTAHAVASWKNTLDRHGHPGLSQVVPMLV